MGSAGAPAVEVVDHGELYEGGEHEGRAGAHPDVNRLQAMLRVFVTSSSCRIKDSWNALLCVDTSFFRKLIIREQKAH